MDAKQMAGMSIEDQLACERAGRKNAEEAATVAYRELSGSDAPLDEVMGLLPTAAFAAKKNLLSEIAARERAERERDTWIETARMHAKNEDWYRGMIDAALVGVPEAFVADDGSVHDTPLRAKFPEILAAEREAHEETRRRHAETLAAVSDRLSLLGRCERAESRLAAALDDRAFLLELLGITVKTGTKDPLLDARLAEARAFLAGGKTK